MDKRLIIGSIIIIIVLSAALAYMLLPRQESALMVLRVGWSGEPTSLDPPNEKNNADIMMESLVHEPLATPSWKGGFNLSPCLATSWEQKNDTCWRFHLREGVYFHDGTPFNASAVKYNIDRLLNKSRLTAQAYLIEGFMKSAEVEDEYTVLFHTLAPSPIVLLSLAHTQLSIISPTACEKYGDADYARHPVGTGAFEFVEWVEGEYVKFKKNENYWGEAAKLDEVIFKIIPEEGTRYMSFLAGELDLISNVLPHRVPEVEADPNFVLLKSPALRVVFFGLNVQRYPLDDVRVRQAIAHVLDRDSIIAHILEGLGLPATVPMPPGVPFRLPEEEYGTGGRYPYDPERAKELLAEAGWVDTDGDGIVDKNGEPFEINLVSPSGRYLKDREIDEVMVDSLTNIGIKVDLQLMEVAAWINRITTGDFDMYLLGWGVSGDIDAIFRRVWYTDPEVGRGVYSTYSNPELDELIEEGVVEMDDEKREEIYYNAQRIIMDDVPMIPIYYTTNLFATTSAVHNVEAKANELVVLSQTWIEPSE